MEVGQRGFPTISLLCFKKAAKLLNKVRKLHIAASKSNEYCIVLLNLHPNPLRPKKVNSSILPGNPHRKFRGQTVDKFGQFHVDWVIQFGNVQLLRHQRTFLPLDFRYLGYTLPVTLRWRRDVGCRDGVGALFPDEAKLLLDFDQALSPL